MADKKLLFGPGGVARSARGTRGSDGVQRCVELGLGCMELEYVYGVRVSEQQAAEIRRIAGENDIKLSAHAPYYINLNSKDPEKKEASIKRIMDSVRMVSASGGDRVVFHAAFLTGDPRENVYKEVKKSLMRIKKEMADENLDHVSLRPELTGKESQFGNPDELIRISREVEGVAPCIDLAHYYARYSGLYNSYDDYCRLLEKIAEGLGEQGLRDMHIHMSGIEFTDKGEKRHLPALESEFNFREALRALKSFNVTGRVISESPLIEKDAMLFKNSFKRLKVK
ncbi:MAG TPA: TIM barrel protein [bacterium]|nr:TIM barrel protein [bacterium]